MDILDIPADETAATIKLGDMGIRQIYQGNSLLYERKASFFFLKLVNEDNENTEDE